MSVERGSAMTLAQQAPSEYEAEEPVAFSGDSLVENPLLPIPPEASDHGDIAGIELDYRLYPETGLAPISGGTHEASREQAQFLTVEEAAELLGVGASQIYNLVCEKKIPAEKRDVEVTYTMTVTRPVKRLFIPREALIEYRKHRGRRGRPPKNQKS